MSISKRIKSSFICKLIGVLIMCAAMALLVLIPITRDIEVVYGDLVAYEDEKNTWGDFAQHTIDVISSKYTDGSTGDVSNFRICVTLIDEDGEHVLSDTRSGEKYVYRKDYIYYYQPEYVLQGFASESEYLDWARKSGQEDVTIDEALSDGVMLSAYPELDSYEFISEGIQDGTTHKAYAVAYFLISEPVVKDDYYDFVKFQDSMSPLTKNFIPVMIVSALVFALSLVYEFSAAGYSKKSDSPELAPIDSFPLDVWMVILAAAFALSVAAAGGLMTHFTVGLIFGWIGAFIIWDVFVFFWLMSLARHAKTKTTAKNLLVYKIASALARAGANSSFWAVFMFICIALYCVILTVAVGYYSGIKIMPVFAVAAVIFAIWDVLYTRSAADMWRGIDELSKGDFSRKIPPEKVKRMPGKMRTRAENLNELAQRMQDSVDEQMKSERLKAELIANVSHDIKTPLTSIITYTDLLRTDPSPEDREKYLEVLARQTQRLKKLTEDVLESSIASSGNIDVDLAPTSIPVIVEQSLAEYREKLDAAQLTTVVDTEGVPKVMADGRLLWRAIRNLLSNVAKYSAPGTRVYIDAEYVTSDDKSFADVFSGYDLSSGASPAEGLRAQSAPSAVVLTIKNTSREQLNITPDELMQRFVRGDRSRHSEGSGLGLNIAGSLLERMGGALRLSIDGDLFTASVILPEAAETPKQSEDTETYRQSDAAESPRQSDAAEYPRWYEGESGAAPDSDTAEHVKEQETNA
ncbi:MAG: sensor histidine kinase [Eubacterium sp.]|jgi:signal transduction histidine kinase